MLKTIPTTAKAYAEHEANREYKVTSVINCAFAVLPPKNQLPIHPTQICSITPYPEPCAFHGKLKLPSA